MSSLSSSSTPPLVVNTNTNTNTTKTKENLDSAIKLILDKNFDADSKICVTTLLKIIDNVIQKPNNIKVRTVRTSNTTIKTKIIDKHGHYFLIACGFILEKKTLLLSEKDDDDERLVLNEINEDTEFLIYARHALARIAVYELNIKNDTLPPFRPPPPPKVIVSQSTNAVTGFTTTTTTNTGFDVYAGRRFDGSQSAATGTNLGPPIGWKSKTETELQQLQKREKKLEMELAMKSSTKNNNSNTTTASKPNTTDRQWTVFLPGQQQQQQKVASTTASAANNVPYVRGMSLKTSSSAKTTTNTNTTSTSNNNNNNNNNNNSNESTNKEDKQLLAKHFQNQFAKQKIMQTQGFTTKAMRDLNKIKKSKIYSHTQLAITFPDGIIIKANFLTTEKLSNVINGLEHDVLFNTDTIVLPKFELYQSPPRTVLNSSLSLKKLDLVPAAKIYLSWKSPGLTKIPASTLGAGWYIRPELLLLLPMNGDGDAKNTATTMMMMTGPAMPISVSVLGGNTKSAMNNAMGAANASLNNNDGNNDNPKKRVKKTKAEKEAELMKRMLGGGR